MLTAQLWGQRSPEIQQRSPRTAIRSLQKHWSSALPRCLLIPSAAPSLGWFLIEMLPPLSQTFEHMVGGTVWGSLGSLALLDKVCSGSRFEWIKTLLLALGSLSFVLVVQDVSTQVPVPATNPGACCHASIPPSWTHIPVVPQGQTNSLVLKFP